VHYGSQGWASTATKVPLLKTLGFLALFCADDIGQLARHATGRFNASSARQVERLAGPNHLDFHSRAAYRTNKEQSAGI
jgi:hypothetical protein